MSNTSRAGWFFLLCTGLVLCGCNKTPAPGNADPGDKTSKAGQPHVNRWPNRAAMLAAAPAEKFVAKEVQVGEETYLLDVPEAAQITTPNDDRIIEVEFAPERKYNIRWAPERIVAFKKNRNSRRARQVFVPGR